MDNNFAESLETWCKEHCILQKCKDGFWKCYENYKVDSSKEFSKTFHNEDRRYVKVVLEKICYCINYTLWTEPTIQIDFNIFLKERNVGWYREIYFTNGEFADDYFVIE